MHGETERRKVLYSKHFVTSQKCPYHVIFDLELDRMQARLGTIVCKFAGDPVMFVVEEAIFVKSEKCPYHVTFDLDLEHTLDAGPYGDHRVQVWSRSSHVCGRRSDFRVVRKVSVSRDL